MTDVVVETSGQIKSRESLPQVPKPTSSLVSQELSQRMLFSILSALNFNIAVEDASERRSLTSIHRLHQELSQRMLFSILSALNFNIAVEDASERRSLTSIHRLLLQHISTCNGTTSSTPEATEIIICS
eukprot:scaffold6881_cov127-Skeletonema_marinoi.AAC.2